MMGWPQFFMLALTFMSVGISLGQDGKPSTGQHSFIATVIVNGFVLWVLYCGGFFG